MNDLQLNFGILLVKLLTQWVGKMVKETNEENEAQEMNESEIDGFLMEEEGGIHIGDIYIPPPPPPALTMENTGPRLVISQIVIEDFKSYAGVQILGPFNKVILKKLNFSLNPLTKFCEKW